MTDLKLEHDIQFEHHVYLVARDPIHAAAANIALKQEFGDDDVDGYTQFSNQSQIARHYVGPLVENTIGIKSNMHMVRAWFNNAAQNLLTVGHHLGLADLHLIYAFWPNLQVVQILPLQPEEAEHPLSQDQKAVDTFIVREMINNNIAPIPVKPEEARIMGIS